MSGYTGPKIITPGEGARTNVEDERASLRRARDHAQEQASHFHREGQQWAQDLAEACRLLREYGMCDPYSGQPYDEVVRFLERKGIR